MAQADYAARRASELNQYKDQTEVHDLPPICFYWLNRYILPEMQQLGITSADQFFASNLLIALDQSTTHQTRRILSLGAGNCDTEIRLAQTLRASGATDFVIHCLDLNEEMLHRGRESAAQHNLTAHIHPLQADFNTWQPDAQYDAILANQALHHVVNLESLFAASRKALTPQGLFITSDMIGRNGHRRWPEALHHVEEFWNELPEPYRYNRQLRRQETTYPDWDCSKEGFEGIRSQDILPLLLETFRFRFFYAFGNVADPFIDRGFGPNFNADSPWDQNFIDRAHARDQTEMAAGRLKPTHMLAVLSLDQTADLVSLPNRTPESSVRRP